MKNPYKKAPALPSRRMRLQMLAIYNLWLTRTVHMYGVECGAVVRGKEKNHKQMRKPASHESWRFPGDHFRNNKRTHTAPTNRRGQLSFAECGIVFLFYYHRSLSSQQSLIWREKMQKKRVEVSWPGD